MLTEPLRSRCLQTLERTFGYRSFRPGQEEVIAALLEGRDCMAVLPTGGGKSLCYQIPAATLDGTALVVSPLIALMKDQVDSARANGIRAACYNSSMSSSQKAQIWSDYQQGRLDLLYVAPERFADPQFLELLTQVPPTFTAIDEAHCMSEWGHDFRPDYHALSNLRTWIPRAPIAAFTATATARVQSDVENRLKLHNPMRVRLSFDRPNLQVEVRPRHKVQAQLLELIRQNPGDATVIYHGSRKSVESTAQYLSSHGIQAAPYHAGLPDTVRVANQEAFSRDEIQVIVATVAFGMGIDKSNVRLVVHADLPKTMEGYYQEIGRAGRDGDPARCVLLFGRGDVVKHRSMLAETSDPDERQRLRKGLEAIAAYAGAHHCRRAQVLEYFGESYPKPSCENCDVCLGQTQTEDATIEAQKFLSTVIRTGNRFGLGHVVDVLMGSTAEKVLRQGHNTLSCYGVGQDRPRPYWARLSETLLAQGLLEQRGDTYPTLAVTPAATPILKGQETLRITLVQETKERQRNPSPKDWESNPHEQQVFEILRAKRLELARAKGLAPYMILSDKSLRDMVVQKPRNLTEMLQVHGVGEVKAREYGQAFLEALADV